jgi:hypothetical protein
MCLFVADGYKPSENHSQQKTIFGMIHAQTMSIIHQFPVFRSKHAQPSLFAGWRSDRGFILMPDFSD